MTIYLALIALLGENDFFISESTSFRERSGSCIVASLRDEVRMDSGPDIGDLTSNQLAQGALVGWDHKRLKHRAPNIVQIVIESHGGLSKTERTASY